MKSIQTSYSPTYDTIFKMPFGDAQCPLVTILNETFGFFIIE